MHCRVILAVIAGLVIGGCAAAEEQFGRAAPPVHGDHPSATEAMPSQDHTNEPVPIPEADGGESVFDDARHEPLYDDRWGRDDRFGYEAPHPNSVRRWKR